MRNADRIVIGAASFFMGLLIGFVICFVRIPECEPVREVVIYERKPPELVVNPYTGDTVRHYYGGRSGE